MDASYLMLCDLSNSNFNSSTIEHIKNDDEPPVALQNIFVLPSVNITGLNRKPRLCRTFQYRSDSRAL